MHWRYIFLSVCVSPGIWSHDISSAIASCATSWTTGTEFRFTPLWKNPIFFFTFYPPSYVMSVISSFLSLGWLIFHNNLSCLNRSPSSCSCFAVAEFTDQPSELKGFSVHTHLVKGSRGFGFNIVGGSRRREFLQIYSITPGGPSTLHTGNSPHLSAAAHCSRALFLQIREYLCFLYRLLLSLSLSLYPYCSFCPTVD